MITCLVKCKEKSLLLHTFLLTYYVVSKRSPDAKRRTEGEYCVRIRLTYSSDETQHSQERKVLPMIAAQRRSTIQRFGLNKTYGIDHAESSCSNELLLLHGNGRLESSRSS